jgi:phytanoyl-CoA hydroxylase
MTVRTGKTSMQPQEKTVDRDQAAGADTFAIKAPDGKTIAIPRAVDDRTDPYLRLTDPAQVKAYYDAEGYVVVRNLVPAALCDEAKRSFEREVKPYPGYIYRQATAVPEKHVFTEHGYMMNSILNIQDLNRRSFPGFVHAGMQILTHDAVKGAVQNLLGEPGKIIQTMYFDGNPATWAHQDTYYLDSAQLGRMTAAWIAVEDIAPGAGRFFVYPKSHRIDMAKNGGDFDIAFNHPRYKQLVLDTIKSPGLECRAPALRRGDVLFWAARTIHGSLETRGSASRASFTGHFIPASAGMLQFQTREKPLLLRTINGVPVHHPKDQNLVRNQAVLALETTFPKAFNLVKRTAIKVLTR